MAQNLMLHAMVYQTFMWGQPVVNGGDGQNGRKRQNRVKKYINAKSAMIWPKMGQFEYYYMPLYLLGMLFQKIR